MRWWFPILFAALLALRVPSLAQPLGADQGLYAYVAQHILRGEVPYRDAWDQKPPAIHYTYALLARIAPDAAVVNAADVAMAATAALLVRSLGIALAGRQAGNLAALFFLLFANPAFTRLGGVRTRSQCETFIAVAVAGALVALKPRGADGRTFAVAAGWMRYALAGVLIGLAFLYKYNAIVYLAVAAAALACWSGVARPDELTKRRDAPLRTGRRAGRYVAGPRRLPPGPLLVGGGFLVPIVVAAVFFGLAGAHDDLVEATVMYNLRYSGDTYADGWAFVRYLLSFPVRHAAVDSLWLLGGLGSAVLLLVGVRRPALLVVPAWVTAACLSIAINGSRGLPQYFVQAAPALALAAGVGFTVVARATRPLPRAIVAVALVLMVSRVTTFEKVFDYLGHDLRYLSGRISREDHLARFGGQRDVEKYSAVSMLRLGEYLRARSTPADRVLVFGFSAGAYLHADRLSASRFFWSYPVIIGFKRGTPGYGAEGLLADLRQRAPKLVALQHDDWEDVPDSATYFMSEDRLAGWLRSGYAETGRVDHYSIWTRSGPSTDATAH